MICGPGRGTQRPWLRQPTPASAHCRATA